MENYWIGKCNQANSWDSTSRFFSFFFLSFFAAFGDGLNNLSKSKCQELGPPYPNEVDHSTHAFAGSGLAWVQRVLLHQQFFGEFHTLRFLRSTPINVPTLLLQVNLRTQFWIPNPPLVAFFDNEFQKRFPNGCPHGVEEGYDPKIFFQNWTLQNPTVCWGRF